MATKVMKKGQARVTGFCQTAIDVEEGRTGSDTSAERWHSMCHDERCECPHHAWPAFVPVTDTGADDRRMDLEARVAAAKAHGSAERAAAAADRAARQVDPENPAKVKVGREVKRDRAILPGRCHHCGEPTKGGIFAPGHDAKLKGILKGAALEGDVAAMTEILFREWPMPKHVTDDILEKAGELASHENVEGWFIDRVQARMADAK